MFLLLTNGCALFQAILNRYTSLVQTVPGTAVLTLNCGTDLVQYRGGCRLLFGVTQPPTSPLRLPSRS